MIRKILVSIVSFACLMAYGQSTSKYEYWIDRGYDARVSQSASGNNISLSIDVDDLATGIHVFNFRAADSNGLWSAPSTSLFFKTEKNTQSNKISKYEYWIDRNIAEKKSVDTNNGIVNLDIDVEHLDDGIHYLCFRAQDANGLWSSPSSSIFIKKPKSVGGNKIVGYQYWLNEDGDKARFVAVDPQNPLVLDVKLPISDLCPSASPDNIVALADENGKMRLAIQNVLYMRFKDAANHYSAIQPDTFLYYIDGNDADFSAFIVNPDASMGMAGWTKTGSVTNQKGGHAGDSENPYFTFGNKANSRWTAQMKQTISKLPAGTYLLSANGRASTKATLSIAVDGIEETFKSLGENGGDGNGWNTVELVFTTDGTPFDIVIASTGADKDQWADIDDITIVSTTYTPPTPPAEQKATLTVRMPDGIDASKYKGMTLKVETDGQTLTVTTTDEKEYVFNDLAENATCRISLINQDGEVVAIVESVRLQAGENSIVLSGISKLYNVRMSVTTPTGVDVTDKVAVRWYDEQGNYLDKGNTLNNIAQGRQLMYGITLNDSLGVLYREPAMTAFTTDADIVRCTLAPIAQTTLSGTVGNGYTTLGNAMVQVKQMLNGRFERSKTIASGKNGEFSIDVLDDSTCVTISSEGYLDKVIELSTLNGHADLGNITLQEINGTVLRLNLSYQSTEGDEDAQQWYTDLGNVDFTLRDITTGKSIEAFTVQNLCIVTHEAITAGHTVEIAATSRTNAFAPTSVRVSISDNTTVDLSLVELGSIVASYTSSTNAECLGILYDANGVQWGRAEYAGWSVRFNKLQNGDYTLVSMANSSLLGSVMNIADLATVGLKDGKDYVARRVRVEAGAVSTVEIDNIPAMNESVFYYTGDGTSFTVNKTSVTVGNYVTLTTKIDFKEEYRDRAKNITLHFDLPEGCDYVDGSAIIGTKLVPCSVADNKISISLPDAGYTERVRFCVVPTESGSFIPSAYVTFNVGKTVTQPLGNVAFTAEKMSIKVPSITAKKQISVRGITMPYSTVNIFDNGQFITSTTTKADGSWMTSCELVDAYNNKHLIKAKVKTPASTILTSEEKEVLYDVTFNTVKNVTMINTAHPANSLQTCEYITMFDFENPDAEIKPYWYWPSYPDFTFLIDFEKNNPDKVSDVVLCVHTSSSNIVRLYPKYDQDKDKWIATSKFYSNCLPVNVSVLYNSLSEEICDSGNIYNAVADEFSYYNLDDISTKGDWLTYTITSVKNTASMKCSYYSNSINKTNTIHSYIHDNHLEPSFELDKLKYYSNEDNTKYALLNETIDSVFLFILENNSTKSFLKSSQRRIFSVDYGSDHISESTDALNRWRDNMLKGAIDEANRKLQCADDIDNIKIHDCIKRLRQGLAFSMASFVSYTLNQTLSTASKPGNAFEWGHQPTGAIMDAAGFGEGIEGLSRNAQDALKTLHDIPECGPYPRDNEENPNIDNLHPVMDPSGYVYEAVSTNRIKDVIATIFYKTEEEDMYGDMHEVITKWDAEEYSQKNPLLTDEYGLYAWDVPQGLWQVKFEKEGYETVLTDWLPVPPPQLDINVPMSQGIAPVVDKARGYESGITLTFSKYMRPESFTDGTVAVTRNGKAEAGKVMMLNAEQEPAGDKVFASKVKFVPNTSFDIADKVIVTVKKSVESYCGIRMAKDVSMTVPIEPEIKAIEVDSVVTVKYHDTAEVTVRVVPAEAAKGKKLQVASSSPMIASTNWGEAVVGNDGTATFEVSGELPGVAGLTFTMADVEVVGQAKVEVAVPIVQAADPRASIRSGLTLPKGTLVELSTTTEGALIYYTLDGSCPCDENSQILYTEPITLNETAVIKAIAVKDGLMDSEIASFYYTVEDPTSIETVTAERKTHLRSEDGRVVAVDAVGAKCRIYSMAGQLLAETRIVNAKQTIDVSRMNATVVVQVVMPDGTVDSATVITQ